MCTLTFRHDLMGTCFLCAKVVNGNDKITGKIGAIMTRIQINYVPYQLLDLKDGCAQVH